MTPMSPDSQESPSPSPRSSPENPGEETWSVRPYTVTGGRTRPSKDALPIEALVRAAGPPNGLLAGERRQIVELAGDYVSIAELSAHLHLPVGVTRVLVGDLRDENLVTIHGLTNPDPAHNPATTLRVLESVLDGISSL